MARRSKKTKAVERRRDLEGFLDSASPDKEADLAQLGLDRNETAEALAHLRYVAVSRCAPQKRHGHSFWHYGPLYSSRETAVHDGYRGICSCGNVVDIETALMAGVPLTLEQIQEAQDRSVAQQYLSQSAFPEYLREEVDLPPAEIVVPRRLTILKKKENPFHDVGMTAPRQWGNAGSGILFIVSAPERLILLLLRSGRVLDAYKWGVPGGAVPEDEEGILMDPWESARREAQEELGSLPDDISFVQEIRRRAPHSDFVYITYVVPLHVGVLKIWEPHLNWEHDDYGWFTIDNALALENLHPGVRYVLKRLGG